MFVNEFMQKAIDKAFWGMHNNHGGPFGAIIVKEGKVVGTGCNSVTSKNDPTAHAEIMAIRDACKNLKTFNLDGCEIYTSCEPCPMCLGAIYWARLTKMYYACDRKDAANAGFDDDFIYKEINLSLNQRSIKTEQKNRNDALKAFEKWLEKNDKIEY